MTLPNSELQLTWASLRSAHAAELCYVGQTSMLNRPPDIEALVSLLRTEDGGRSTPVASGYRPNHRVRDDYRTTGVHTYPDRERVFPGETVAARITLLTPEAYPHCLEVGQVLEVAEGGHQVGTATVTRVLNPLLLREPPTL